MASVPHFLVLSAFILLSGSILADEVYKTNTNIDIYVVGVFHTGDRNSTAFLVMDNFQKTLGTGETIYPGVKISEIGPESIKIQSGNNASIEIRVREYKKIETYDKHELSKNNTHNTHGREDTKKTDSEIHIEFYDRRNDFIQKEDKMKYKIDRDYLLMMYKQGRLMSHALFNLNDNNEIVVEDVLNGSVFYRAGFREKDIIHSINGKEIKSLSDLLQLSNKFDEFDEIVIELSRDRKKRTMSYQLTHID